MDIYIKNPHATNVINYLGQDIDPLEYFLIPTDKITAWQADSSLLADIANTVAIVARDNSGNNNITNLSDAINYLKGNLPVMVKQIAVSEPNGKRARLVGTHSKTAAVDTTTNADWLIPQLQWPAGTDVNSIFDGIQYYAENGHMGDTLCFSVVDKDGSGVGLGLYSQATFDAIKDVNGEVEVEKFGLSWYVVPNQLEDIILYKAALLPGLYIRAKYTNTHATETVAFICNIFRHLDI